MVVASMTWSDWLALIGAICLLIGLLATWLRLERVWRTRWPDEELIPLARLRQFVKRSTRWFTAPFQNSRGRIFDASGTAAVESRATGEAVVSFSENRSLDERLARVESFLVQYQTQMSREMRAVRSHVDHVIAGVTDEQQKQWEDNDADTMKQLRTALGWPALLIVFAALLQCAAILLPW